MQNIFSIHFIYFSNVWIVLNEMIFHHLHHHNDDGDDDCDSQNVDHLYDDCGFQNDDHLYDVYSYSQNVDHLYDVYCDSQNDDHLYDVYFYSLMDDHMNYVYYDFLNNLINKILKIKSIRDFESPSLNCKFSFTNC